MYFYQTKTTESQKQQQKKQLTSTPERLRYWSLACTAGVFSGRANVFAHDESPEERRKWGESKGPSPSLVPFFGPRTYPKDYFFYSPQSSSVIKSKTAATTMRTWASFLLPKILLHYRLTEAIMADNGSPIWRSSGSRSVVWWLQKKIQIPANREMERQISSFSKIHAAFWSVELLLGYML